MQHPLPDWLALPLTPMRMVAVDPVDSAVRVAFVHAPVSALVPVVALAALRWERVVRCSSKQRLSVHLRPLLPKPPPEEIACLLWRILAQSA